MAEKSRQDLQYRERTRRQRREAPTQSAQMDGENDDIEENYFEGSALIQQQKDSSSYRFYSTGTSNIHQTSGSKYKV